jgi:hypothetical protein
MSTRWATPSASVSSALADQAAAVSNTIRRVKRECAAALMNESMSALATVRSDP